MEVTTTHILLLCLAAFAAGFVDAVVGGGGLIQTPAALLLLPAHPVAAVIGTVKIPSFTGTLIASVQYVRRVRIRWGLTALLCAAAFGASYAGSDLLTRVPNDFMKPVLVVVLAGVALYTFLKKDFGQQKETAPKSNIAPLALLLALVIGFYDGFIGPGTGSLFILGFVSLLRFDFLHASAQAKLVNLATNLGSIVLFTFKGTILWPVALPMALSNAAGGWLGARLAIARGNRFIRIFFLLVITATLLRFSYDVFFK